jgi:transcriptional regulator with XRE-family HTH domain
VIDVVEYSAKDMAQRIKVQRKKLGYTQDEMSERIGLSASSYTKIENAFQNPSLETIIKLSRELQMSLDYMIFGTRHRQKDTRRNDALTAVAKMAEVDKLIHANDILNKIIKALQTNQ